MYKFFEAPTPYTDSVNEYDEFCDLSTGLVLQLYVEEDEYIGALSHTEGVRVVVHEQGTMPFPDEDGFNVAPGTATSVSLTKVSTVHGYW